MKKVIMYTDGACSGNPGKGGWAAICLYGEYKKTFTGFEEQTTNNRMELTAVINGLKALKEPCDVEIYSDSQYVCDALNSGWLKNWQANGWIGSNKKPVKNVDLWKDLDEMLNKHVVTFHKVTGHNGNPLNEEADKLAVAEYKKK